MSNEQLEIWARSIAQGLLRRHSRRQETAPATRDALQPNAANWLERIAKERGR